MICNMFQVYVVSQVLSLDISEFSPDAEDTRPNMLLAQLFYHFSLGVASRPDTKGTRRGSGAGLEVEAKVGSFRLQDQAGYLPPRIQTDKDVVRAAVVDPVP
jgi:hypothetical protein